MGYEIIMADSKFVEMAKLAVSVPTLYVNGCFGAPMTDYNKKRYMNNTAFNKAPNRQKLIAAATPDTFGFDCINLIKGILYGWKADENAIYGGAEYKAHGVPDFPVDGNAKTKGLLDYCTDVSTDFSKILPGEVLHIPGHAGIYIGDGLCAECTYRWKDGVQITAVANMGNNKKAINHRTWNEHGRLVWIDYQEAKKDIQYSVTLDIVRPYSEGASVLLVQKLLNSELGEGYELTENGICDNDMLVEIKDYQKRHGLEADGIVGTKTWSALLGIEVTKL